MRTFAVVLGALIVAFVVVVPFARRRAPRLLVGWLALVGWLLVGGGWIVFGFGAGRWVFVPIIVGTLLMIPEHLRRPQLADGTNLLRK